MLNVVYCIISYSTILIILNYYVYACARVEYFEIMLRRFIILNDTRYNIAKYAKKRSIRVSQLVNWQKICICFPERNLTKHFYKQCVIVYKSFSVYENASQHISVKRLGKYALARKQINKPYRQKHHTKEPLWWGKKWQWGQGKCVQSVRRFITLRVFE